MSIHLKHHILSKPPNNGKYYLVAIDGRGGSGKTTLAEYVITLLPGFILIKGDDYFEPTPNAVAWGAFNDERFIEDVIDQLKQGKEAFVYRPYDWHSKPNIKERTIKIDKGLCIERSFSLGFNLDWDCKIWVETPAQIALQRGQERDQMPLEQGYRAWKEVWQPQEDAHFAKIKPLETADIVIDGTQPFNTQVS